MAVTHTTELKNGNRLFVTFIVEDVDGYADGTETFDVGVVQNEAHGDAIADHLLTKYVVAHDNHDVEIEIDKIYKGEVVIDPPVTP